MNDPDGGLVIARDPACAWPAKYCLHFHCHEWRSQFTLPGL